MKKIISIMLAAMLAAGCLLMAGCGKKDTIIVQTNAYFAPFEYYDGTTIVGVDVDIMNKVGEKLGKKVEFDNKSFSVIIDNVAAGKICDVGAAGITVTDERKEKVDFSDTYFTSVQYVIYKTGTMTTDGTDGDIDYILWDSLAGKKIGVQRDTTGDVYVDGEINATEDDEDYGYNGVLLGTAISDVSLPVVLKFEEALGQYAYLSTPILRVLYEMANATDTERVHVEGVTKLFSYPEFNNVTKAKGVLELIGEREKFAALLSAADPEKANVFIGGDDTDSPLPDSSFVLRPVTVDGKTVGAIGVIGPKRMDYKKVLASLDYFATGLSEELDGHDRSNTET